MNQLTRILLIIGGLNWGLIGLGIFIKKDNLNFIKLLEAFYPNLPAIIYCAIGFGAIYLIFKKG